MGKTTSLLKILFFLILLGTMGGVFMAFQSNTAIEISGDITHISCPGDDTGAIAITASGGSGEYEYSWTGPGTFTSTDDDISGLKAGSYTITVTDKKNNSNFGNKTFSVSQPDVLIMEDPTSTPVSCNAGNDGTATAGNVSGGNGGYQYKIGNGTYSTNKTFSNLTAGTYTIYVKDAKNCETSKPVTVTEPDVLVMEGPSSTPVSCNSGNDGTATAGNVSGGNGGYQYKIGNGTYSTNKTFSNLTAGTYTIYVKDAKNCETSKPVTVTEPDVLVMEGPSSTPVSCNSGNDGTATAGNVSGGNGGYQYKIGNGTYSTNNSFNNLSAGKYTIYVKDSKGCEASKTITVTEPDVLVMEDPTSTPVSCNGGNDGTATAGIVSGGNGGYQYKIGNGTYSTNKTFNNLSAGTYTIYVKDLKGCETSKTITVTEPNILIMEDPTSTLVSCNAGNDGTATAGNVSGGNGGYQYKIGNGTYSTNNSFNNLSAGKYTIYVKDSKGCEASKTITVTEPDVLVMEDPTSTPVSCNGGNDGTATAGIVSGGNGGYQYKIGNGTYSTNNSFNNLSAGKYTIYVKDSKGCETSKTITVTEPEDLTMGAPTFTDFICIEANNGSAIAGEVSGGNGGYRYSIDGINFSDSNTFSNLTAGDYTITVKDSKDCTTTTQFTIQEFPEPTVSTTLTSQTYCNGVPTPKILLSGTPTGVAFNITSNKEIGLQDKFDVTEIPSFTPINNSDEPVEATITITPFANGCKGTPVDYDITVNPTPRLEITGNQSICSGKKTSISLSSNIPNPSFEWTITEISPAGSIKNVQIGDEGSGDEIAQELILEDGITNPVTVKYEVIPEANECGGAIGYASVIVNPLPKFEVTIPECVPFVDLTASEIKSNPNLTYTYWTDPEATSKLSNPEEVGLGTYYVKGTSSTGCYVVEDVVVEKIMPALTNSLENEEICSGALFEYEFSGNIPIEKVYWNRPETAGITGFSSGEGNISEPLVNNTNKIIEVTYEIILEAKNGCISDENSNIVISVPVLPEPNLTGNKSFEVCSGSAVMTDNATDISGASLTWQIVPKDGIEASRISGNGKIDAILTNTTSDPINVEFIYEINYKNCTSNQESIFVKVKPAPIVKAGVSMFNQDKADAVDEITICHPSSPADINSVKLYSDGSIPFDTEQSQLNLKLDDFALWNSTSQSRNWEIGQNDSTAYSNYSPDCSFIEIIFGLCDLVDVKFNSNDNSDFFLIDGRNFNVNASTLILKDNLRFSTVGQEKVTLTFYHYFDNQYGQGHVEYRADGIGWRTLDSSLPYDSNIGSPDNFEKSDEFVIPGGLENVQIRFRYEGGYADRYWAINNITVTGIGTNPPRIIWTRSDDPAWSIEGKNLLPEDIGPVNQTTTFTATYTYDIEDEENTCSTGSDSVIVKVREPLTPKITANYCAFEGIEGKENTILLSVEGVDNIVDYQWRGQGINDSGINCANSDCSSIEVDLASTYFLTVEDANGCSATTQITISDNLVTNGNFDEIGFNKPFNSTRIGNEDGYPLYEIRDANNKPVFISQYNLRTGPRDNPTRHGSGALGSEGTIAIDKDASDYHNDFEGNDHTTGNGNFLMINGAEEEGKVIWRQSFQVKPHTQYYFSAWGTNLVGRSSAELNFLINGSPLNEDYVKTADLSTVGVGSWVQVYNTRAWDSGNNNKVTIEIINENEKGDGNDFGIDDISFAELSSVKLEFEVTNNGPICEGGTIELQAEITEGGRFPITFEWTGPEGSDFSNKVTVNNEEEFIEAQILEIPDAKSEMAGEYSLKITDFYGCEIEPKTTTVEVPVLNTGEEENLIYCADEIEENGIKLEGSIDNLQDTNLELSAGWETDGNGTIEPATDADPNTFPITYFPSPEEIQNGATISFKLEYSGLENNLSCSKALTITINPTPRIKLEEVSIINVSCKAGNDGKAFVTVNDENTAFSYEWTQLNPESEEIIQTSENPGIEGLKAGKYRVRKTNIETGCSSQSVEFEILEPTALKIEERGFSEPQCGDNNNTAFIELSGGYIEGLTAAYIVTFYDDQENEVDLTVSETSKEALTGAIPTYTYTATNLPAGTYTFNVSAGTECSATAVSLTIPYIYCVNLDFDGDDDYVDLGNFTGNYSIAAWVRPETDNGTILSNKDKNGNGFELTLNNKKPSFSWNNNTVTSDYPIGINDRWYHIAVSFDGKNAKLYVDGIFMKEGNSQNQMTSSTSPLLIGASASFDSISKTKNHFSGWIEEVRLWEKKTTKEQIRFLMNQRLIDDGNGQKIGAEIPPAVEDWTFDGLDGYYQLIVADIDKNNGTTPDFSNNDQDGTLKNMESSQENTAPLPYISNSNGNWFTDATWLRPNVWDPPNSLGIDKSTKIDWNIAKISHSINSGEKNITLLGLISKKDTLDMEGINPTYNKDNKTTAPGTGNALVVTHYLKLEGIIDLNGESQLIQTMGSILDASSSGYIERDQQGTQSSYNYNYWSSPVSSNSAINSGFTIKNVLRDGTNPQKPGPINYQQKFNWADGKRSSPIKISTYWLNIYTNFASNTYSKWYPVGEMGQIQTGEGFTMKGTSGTAKIAERQNYVFVGKPNNGTITLQVTSGNDYLIGNPYPSAIDGKKFILDNIKSSGGNNSVNVFNGTLYFWDHFGGSSHYLKEYVGGYATLNLTGSIEAVATDERINATGEHADKASRPKQFIPVAQGFYISTQDATEITDISGGNIIFKNSQRAFVTESSGESIFKSKETKKPNQKDSDTRKKIWLKFHSPTGYNRQILVGVDSSATDGFDIGYDAPLFGNNKEDMYWMIQDVEFVIQGVPDFNKERELPLGIKTAVEGKFTIAIDELKNIPDDFEIYLKDSITQERHNLRESKFVATDTAGIKNNRYYLVFQNIENPDPDTSGGEENNGDGENEEGDGENSGDGENGENEGDGEKPEETGEIQLYFVSNTHEVIIENPQLIPIGKAILYNFLGQELKIFKPIPELKLFKLPIRQNVVGVYVIKLELEDGTISKQFVIEGK